MINHAIIDGQNASYEYERSLSGKRTFSYEGLVEMLKTTCQDYGLRSKIALPGFLLESKKTRKCNNPNTISLIKYMADKGLIIITGSAKENDDKEMIFWAMKKNAVIISNDRGLEKHIASLPHSEMIIAKKWLKKNTIRFRFYKGEMVLQNYLPRFKEREGK